jgi:hypothetical protein
VKFDCFGVLSKYNIIVDCVCLIGLFLGLLKYNIIVECVCEVGLLCGVIEA